MFDAYLATAGGLLFFYLVGFAIFTTLEILAPMKPMGIADRARGLRFMLATVVLDAWVITLANSASQALQITPLITLKFDVGSAILAAIITALWLDFIFYWFHRIQHWFLWRFHAVHHSAEHLTAVNSYHHWAEPPFRALIVGFPLLFIHFEAIGQAVLLAFIFRIQVHYIHSPSTFHFGPLRWLLVDNRYHRIHHSLEPHYHEKNFAAMTPLWDWLFGTMYMPKPHEWPDVGVAGISEPKTISEWSSLPWRISRVGARGRRKNVPPRDEADANVNFEPAEIGRNIA